MKTEADVRDSAMELARALKGTAVWREWEDAQVALDAAGDVASLQSRLDALTQHWQEAQLADGHLPSSDDVADLQRQLREHPAVTRQRDAAERLIELLRGANDALSAHLGVDFAENAARGSSATCCR